VSLAVSQGGHYAFNDIQAIMSGKVKPTLRALVDSLESQAVDLKGDKAPEATPFDPARLAGPANFMRGTGTAGLALPMLAIQGAIFVPHCMALHPERKTLALGGLATVVTKNSTAKVQAQPAILVWDLTMGQVKLLKGHDNVVCTVAFAPDGQTLASGGVDRTIKLWDLAKGRERATLNGHTAPIFSLAYSSDGKMLASGALDGGLRVWDPDTGQLKVRLRGHMNPVGSLAFTPDSRTLVAGSVDMLIKVWNPAAEQGPVSIREKRPRVSAMAFSPDGQALVSIDELGTLKRHDPSTGRLLPAPSAKIQLPVVLCAGFSPDGKRLALGSTGDSVSLCDAATGRELRKLPGHKGMVYALEFSPDGRTLAVGTGHRRKAGEVKLWDVASGKELRSLQGYTSHVVGLAFSPNGTALATASLDHTVKLWDPVTGTERFSSKEDAEALCVAFSPDGKRFVAGSSEQVSIRDAGTGELLRTIHCYSHQVVDLAFSPDGRRLATAGGQGMLGRGSGVKLWDPETGRELITLGDSVDPISSVAFSPDGKRLAASVGSSFSWFSPVTREPNAELLIWNATPLPEEPAPRPPGKNASRPTRATGSVRVPGGLLCRSTLG
jgi:WD40 repeat protein